jgi:predicted dehydrogenase
MFMADGKKIRIGFVGVGGMGQCAHLRSYVTVDGCEVAAIAEVREKTGALVAEHYGVPHVYPDHREMLAAEDLDAIVASQPFTRHGTLLPELAEAGIPLFSEKPLAGSVEMGEKIVDAVKRGGSFHMVGYNKRSDPAVMYAKEEIVRLRKSGELGALTYVRILIPPGDWIAGGYAGLLNGGDPAPKLPSDPRPADMDEDLCEEYIAFVNYYIHQVNLMRHLLGAPYRAAYADPSGVVLAVESAEGTPGVIEMGPYQTTRGWQESALVTFERGYVRIDLRSPLARNRPGRVEVFRDPGEGCPAETLVPDLPPVDSMQQQAVNFVAAVRGEIEPPCVAEEALEDLKVAREYLRILKGR